MTVEIRITRGLLHTRLGQASARQAIRSTPPPAFEKHEPEPVPPAHAFTLPEAEPVPRSRPAERPAGPAWQCASGAVDLADLPSAEKVHVRAWMGVCAREHPPPGAGPSRAGPAAAVGMPDSASSSTWL
jgi:hypothetical protein